MPIELLVAPPAAGKTQYCIEKIIQLARQKQPASIWVLVPDGVQASAFRQRLARAGGALGVVVNTFGSFYRQLLMRNGQFISSASKTMVQQLVRKAISEVDLTYFAEIADMPGFVQVLVERFGELKRGLVYPDTLLAQAANEPLKVQELAAIYARYQAYLQQIGWADDNGFGWLALELLEKQGEAAPSMDLMVLDGFDSFTAPQYRTLELLTKDVPQLLVTLPGMPGGQRRVNRRFENTMQRMQTISGVQVVELDEPARVTPALRQIVTGLGEREHPPMDAAGQVFFYEARTQAEEAREALRWIKSLVVREGVSLHECVIVTQSPEVYQPYLKAAANEFGLPIRFTVNEALLLSPAFAALENLLEIVPKKAARRQLLDALGSPYFDLTAFGLGAASAGLLDQVSRHYQVIEGAEVWAEVLQISASQSAPVEDERDERDFMVRLPTPAEAQTLLVGLAQLLARLQPTAAAQSLTAWVAWLEDLLDDVKFFENSQLAADQLAYGLIRQLLRQLVQAEAVVGESAFEYRQFVRILHQTAASIRLPDAVPFTRPAVKVLPYYEGRGLRSQAVAVLGLAEGAFPEIQRPDPFLDETLRAALGVEPAIDPHQVGLFYLAVTRSDRYLLLSRPYLADDGELWEPSPFWKLIKRLFTGEAKRINPDALRPIEDAASEAEALAWAVRRQAIPAEIHEHLAERVAANQHARRVLAAREADAPDGEYEGFPAGLAEHMGAAYGPEKVWSASRLETYTSCPFQFFVSQVLGLEAPLEPEPGFDARQLGTVLHRILEYTYARADDPTNLDSLLAAFEQVVDQELAAAPQAEGFRPTVLWEKEKVELRVKLEETIRELFASSGSWTPAAHEARFGLRGAPPARLPLSSGTIQLRGLIDRVDVNANHKLRIIDYKTGSSHQTKNDLVSGRRLQLPLYALAAEQALEMGEVVDGFYWQILAGKAGGLRLAKFEDGVLSAVQTALAHADFAVRGVRAAVFPPQPLQGECPSYCPAGGWCWRYDAPSWGGS